VHHWTRWSRTGPCSNYGSWQPHFFWDRIKLLKNSAQSWFKFGIKSDWPIWSSGSIVVVALSGDGGPIGHNHRVSNGSLSSHCQHWTRPNATSFDTPKSSVKLFTVTSDHQVSTRYKGKPSRCLVHRQISYYITDIMRSLLAIIIALTAALSVNACHPVGGRCLQDSDCCPHLWCDVSTSVNRLYFIQWFNYVGRPQRISLVVAALHYQVEASRLGVS
jgi:hypothetical protein